MPYESPFQSSTSRTVPIMDRRAHASNQAESNLPSTFFRNASGPRHNTDIHMYNAIKAAHPDVNVIDIDAYNVNIINYVSSSGVGKVTSLSDSSSELAKNSPFAATEKHVFATSMNHVMYFPPYRRLDGGSGILAFDPIFDKYLLEWEGHEFLVYIVDGRDGNYPFGMQKSQFILTTDTAAAYTLIKSAGGWANTLHDEIWVFDQGFWQKDSDLYRAIMKSSWDRIILPTELKEDLIETIQRFYDSRSKYEELGVPWKRGLIFYGPPGNGKTVSIKATMKTLYDRENPVPSLYVKSLVSFGGPEYAISAIFEKARQEAPCYLIFEDLDSLVSDDVRSFFLNAVDGLAENEGILMVGSTNHLERLDPGIAKRPSRFDRKYLFPDPDLKQRVEYCKFWQGKLKGNKDVEFPDQLLEPIARLTDKFSFAYMQEAFVSTLLTIANREKNELDCQQAEEQDDPPAYISSVEDDLVVVDKNPTQPDDQRRARAVYPFTAGEITELSFAEGEELILEGQSYDDWWLMRRVSDGVRGYVPRNYVVLEGGSKEDDLNKFLLWREIKVQIANLKKELNRGDE